MKEAGKSKSAECGTRLQADKSVALRAERRAGRVARSERREYYCYEAAFCQCLPIVVELRRIVSLGKASHECANVGCAQLTELCLRNVTLFSFMPHAKLKLLSVQIEGLVGAASAG